MESQECPLEGGLLASLGDRSPLHRSLKVRDQMPARVMKTAPGCVGPVCCVTAAAAWGGWHVSVRLWVLSRGASWVSSGPHRSICWWLWVSANEDTGTEPALAAVHLVLSSISLVSVITSGLQSEPQMTYKNIFKKLNGRVRITSGRINS